MHGVGFASMPAAYRDVSGHFVPFREPTTVVDAMEDGRITSASAQALVRCLGEERVSSPTGHALLWTPEIKEKARVAA